MVQVAGVGRAMDALKASVRRGAFLVLAVAPRLHALLRLVHGARAAEPVRRRAAEVRLQAPASRTTPTGPGLYFVGPGVTMHTFPAGDPRPRGALTTATRPLRKAGSSAERRVEAYFDRRARLLGRRTHRIIDALNIQTSDGYAVTTDVTLLYSIEDPVRVASDFGWGSLYVDSFVINTFRNGVLSTLGKMNAESFYDEAVRIAAVEEAEGLLRQRFAERGFKVEKLLLRSYRYADAYEKSLEAKKVAVQLTEKNRKESLVNEEKAKLQQIESKGNAAITIAESEVNARIAQDPGRGRPLLLPDPGPGRQGGQRRRRRGEAPEGRRPDHGRRPLRGGPRDREDVRQHRGRRHDARAVHHLRPQRLGPDRREPGRRHRGRAGRGRQEVRPRSRGSLLLLAAALSLAACGATSLHRGGRAHEPLRRPREARRAADLRAGRASTSSCPSSTPGTRCPSRSRTC